ncbi:MAG: hypothetical protein WBB85_07810 [Albidovulum sp.]|uniref:hypothetical protein n=1 Tax=Albidovulum sp. TaxID=1872424 RepID=UPI003CB3BD50
MELTDLPRPPQVMELTSPYMLLLGSDMLAGCGGAFLEDCIVAEAEFDRIGRFAAVDLGLLESKFLARIDFPRSEIMTDDLVRMFGPRAADCDAERFSLASADEFAARKKAVGFYVVLYARKLMLREPWPTKFFSFDKVLYASTELEFDACGLQREACTCELAEQ